MDHAEQSSSNDRTRREVVRGRALDLYASAAAFALPKRDDATRAQHDPPWLA